MASKVSSSLEKFGLTAKKKKTKKEKSRLPVVENSEMASQVDSFLEAERRESAASSEKKEAAAQIQIFAIDHAKDIKSMGNFILKGTTGMVNISYKDQYELKDREDLDEVLKEKFDLDPDEFIDEVPTLKFEFNKLTDEEKEKFLTFLSEEFGQDRFEQIVTADTKYKPKKGLKDRIVAEAKTMEDLAAFREASGHHTPTILTRVEK